MNNFLKLIIKTNFICLCVLMVSLVAWGDNSNITLPYSTTFNCPTWDYNSGPASPACPTGLQEALGGTGDTQICSAANNPNGGGGLGLRMWITDGQDNQSQSYYFIFNSLQTEIWIRFYVRYQSGFTWSSIYSHKWLYFYDQNMSTSVYCSPTGTNGIKIAGVSNGGTANEALSASGGWNSTWASGATNSYGYGASAGTFHCVEFHMKMDTTGTGNPGSGYNGVADIWVDGVNYDHETTSNFSGGSSSVRQGWHAVALNINQDTPANASTIGSPAYVDYDDIAIVSTTPSNKDSKGYPMIGPLQATTGITTPAIPTGVQISIINK